MNTTSIRSKGRIAINKLSPSVVEWSCDRSRIGDNGKRVGRLVWNLGKGRECVAPKTDFGYGRAFETRFIGAARGHLTTGALLKAGLLVRRKRFDPWCAS